MSDVNRTENRSKQASWEI